ncbi:Uu.00g132570.m01.CDS01 [Anthostomella pinea]|uniref:Uu.00g132570.m01.CDS01 n=1 Tax=Anthostomella pinea TaxID=933095 RepID=A0AAI8YFY9_9PEZI|nr:Uu.00g132570.m01.CDS01 [Anthostomella pinea]
MAPAPAPQSEGLSIFNASPKTLGGPVLLHDLVSLSDIDGTPAIDFLSAQGERVKIPYSQLHAASAALASHISNVLGFTSSSGTPKPLVVPILAPQSPELYVALFAILKAGGAFCPLNLDAPPERIKFILKDVGASVVLASGRLVSKVPTVDESVRVISIDNVLSPLAFNTRPSLPAREATQDDLAYVMYTSGSTGTPKGVGISHFSATQALLAHDRHIPLFKRFLQFAAPTFDVSVFEIFFPLFRGETLVCCNRAEMLTDLPAILRKMDVDACELTPSVAGSLLKTRSNAPGLRLLLTIGEMLTEPVIQEFGGDEHQESLLWALYGPTEATIHCTLQSAFSKTSGRNSIGTSLDTVSAFIIDLPGDRSASSQLDVLPFGHVGELAVGGSQLATGYINRPEQTSASFIDTQWGRIYKTGDKASMQPNGTIQCFGRIDDAQVKLNGQRLELGEVEHALLRVPGCHGAFATVVSNALVAFAAVDSRPDMREQLFAGCKAWLPSFMIPSEVMTMDAFPRLPSGKIDRRKLVQPYEASTGGSLNADVEGYFENEQERLLCELASQLLAQSVTPSTRFSSARLDSLAAIEYASALRGMGIDVDPIDILSARTPRDLWRSTQTTTTSASRNRLPTSSNSTEQRPPNQIIHLSNVDASPEPNVNQIERVEPCTALQESMIAETLKDPRLYINQTELRVPGTVALDSIRSWLVDLAQRNEILRTGFAYSEDKLCQIIWKTFDNSQLVETEDSDFWKPTNTELFLRRPLRINIKLFSVPSRSHVVLLTLHHSIYDGWTIDLLTEDLSRLAGGQQPIERPQFQDVSAYLVGTSGTEPIDSREFWAEHLRDSSPGPVPNFKTVRVMEPLIRSISEIIPLEPAAAKDAVLQSSVGPQVIFQACLGWLWGALNGTEDVIMGSVSSGRALPIAGIEKIMGPCVATLPLRVNLGRFRTIREFLQSIQATNRDTLRYGRLPLVDIKRAAGLATTSKLFDVIFAYQETLASRRQSSNIVRETGHKDAVEAKLLVEVQPLEKSFLCQMTWHTDVFSETQIGIFVRHLTHLVDYFMRHDDATIASIPHSFPIENLSRYNHAPKRIKTLSSLSGLVEKTASQYPAKNALQFNSSFRASEVGSETLTYYDLNSKANQMARYLQQNGASPRGIVAIVLDKSPLLYCSILAILKTGCAYLPILPTTPMQRVLLILEQAQPQICLVDAMTCPFLAAEKTPCSIIDINSLRLHTFPDANLDISGNLCDLAYIIYTSGTTGVPKGVSVMHGNMLSNIEVLSRIYPHDPSDRMLQACSQAFDVSVFEIFFAWANGMCLCSVPNDALFEDLAGAVRALGVTHLSMTVTVASLLNPSHVPNVKFLVTSGEPMTDEVLETWSTYLYQGYGPSETTNICTVRKVETGDSSQFLGWSFDNTSTFVFDPQSTDLVPIGCVGELCFGGDQVASGYLKLPETTSAKFIDHPQYGRMYRSGDIGRMLPDGSLVILGRLDTQVKLRGSRIELQEIQATALRNGNVKTCTSVLVTLRGTGTQQLALFCVPADHEPTKFGLLPHTDSLKQMVVALRRELQGALPGYSVPSFIVPISALPLTSSGKVDDETLRRSVDELTGDALSFCSSAQDETEDMSEWNAIETLIAEILSDTLKVDKNAISRWCSFAALGLDSITAMPIARKLQSALQKRIPLSLVLQNTSIGRLALAISEVEVPVDTRPGGPLLPMKLIETVRKRFTDAGTPSLSAGPSYYNQMLFRLHVPSEVMMRYWNSMFQRHDILRTCFVTTDDVRYPAVQVVLGSHVPTWQVLEADAASPGRRVTEHVNSILKVVDSGEPPASLAIVQSKDSGEYLSFVCHHAIYDGISMRIMLSEVEALHRQEQLSAPLPFETFLRETFRSPPGTTEFWTKHLLGYSPRRLRQMEFEDDSKSRLISARASTFSLVSLELRLKKLGVSLLSLCQAAWSITLSMLQNSSDICFGNVLSGRSITMDGIDTLVAPCFNTIPVRLDLSDSRFLIEAMKAFQSLNAETLPFQFTSLRHVHSQLSASSRLFDTVLILQPEPTPLDESLWSLEQEDGAMDVPIVCEVVPSKVDDALMLHLHRDPSLFSHQTLLTIAEIFCCAVDTSLRHPSSYLLTTAMLPSQLQDQLGQSFFESIQEDRLSQVQLTAAGEDWSPKETSIRKVLSKLSQVFEEKIERHTPIYRYGLDSIAAVQFATLLRREQIAVSALDILENPTCAGIASCATRKPDAPESVSYDFDCFQSQVSSDLQKAGGLSSDPEAVLPCTATQEGMVSQFLASKGRYYFNYTSWSLDPELGFQQVVDSWIRLAARHQILRTGFGSVDHQESSFAMVVYPETGLHVPVSFHQSNSFDVKLWRSQSAASAFQSLSRPPWRVAVVKDEGKAESDLLTMHLAIHHALYDAFSLRVLLDELASIISGRKVEAQSSIQPALSHYFSSVHSSEQAAEAFWRGKADQVVVNKFPTMTPLHVDSAIFSSISKSFSVPSRALRLAAADAGVTVQAALQGAWARLLSAYLGESCVTFGVVFDGQLLQSMVQYNEVVRRYEHTPLPQIQRWLGRPDGQLFDTILIYQVSERPTVSLPWTVLEEIASVDYALSLEVEESLMGTTQLNLSFDTNKLPHEQASILLAQFDAILGDLIRSPKGHAIDLTKRSPSLFSILPAECQQLPSSAQLAHQLVEHSAQRMPHAVALEFADGINDAVQSRQWTYRELNDMGNRVAHLILRQNIPPNSIVATCFNKCPEAYFTILGILKAGCAFLSLDPSAPMTRHEFILADSDATLLMVENRLANQSYLNVTPMLVVSEKLLDDVTLDHEGVTRKVSPSDTCYCLYTSGTTGAPKGCLISHDNVIQAMAAFEHLFAGHWDSRSRWLQFASFHFDVSVLEQYWSWYVGITVVAAPKDLVLSDLASTISRLAITHIDLTPSLARLVQPDEVPSLCNGVFITGGEQLRQEILDVWGPQRVIYNAYGPTEATIGVTMRQRVPQNGRSSNIGSQFPNVGTYVFEPGTQVPVLRGGVGELCVSGRLVGSGYLKRQKLTDERFPTLEAYGERVYRTGDLVRVLHDGSFDFLGRADDQVKLRGQRLETGEINHVIKDDLAHEISDVVTVVTRRAKQDRDLLVSFISPSVSTGSTEDLIVFRDKSHVDLSRRALDACRGRLPGYMVPTYVLCVPFLPLSPNNKADTNRLKQLFADLSQDQLRDIAVLSAEIHRALNETELVVSRALCDVVPAEVNDISPSSTIYQLGIDSITVTRLARQLRVLGFPSASPSLILRHPQISQLARVLTANTADPTNHALQIKQSIRALCHKHIAIACRDLEVDKTEIEYIAPCTPLQEGMVVRSRVKGTKSAYFNLFVIDLDPQVSVDHLKTSFERLAASFPVLRTAFLETTDGCIQVALRSQTLPWSNIENCSASLEKTIADRRQSWIQKNQPILRYPIEVDCIELGGKHVLVLRLFHAVYDAHSFEMILRNVSAEYHGVSYTYGPAFVDVLPEGPLLNHNYSRPFWESLFKDHSFQPMPNLAFEADAGDVFTSRMFQVNGLEARRKALGVTHQTMLQAAWLATLRQYFNHPPTLGIVFSGRSLMVDGIDSVVGPMFNTLPFRVDCPHGTTWDTMIQRVHEYNTTVLAFVHTPLRDIQKWCSKGQPLFDSIFTFDREDTFGAEARSPWWCSIDSSGQLDYPLSVEVVLTCEQTLRVTIAAQSEFADSTAAAFLLDEFGQSLEMLAASSDTTHVPMSRRSHHDGTIAYLSSGTSDSRSSTPTTPSTATTAFVWEGQAQKIRHQFASLAGVDDEDITETTNVFELGLDSIDMIKLSARLNRLGFKVSASTLLTHSTIESILLLFNETTADDVSLGDSAGLNSTISLMSASLARTVLDFKDVEAVLPPTPLQDAMVADMLLSNFQRYFNHDVLEVLPGTDIDRLKSAWATVYARSPILRTTFAEIDDPRVPTAYCQIVKKARLGFEPSTKISSLDDIVAITDRARDRAARAKGTSDLLQIHVAIMPTKTFLVLSVAHALYDGWSLDMLHTDVQAAYEGDYRARGQYRQYLSRLHSMSGSAATRFWADILHNAHPTLLGKARETPNGSQRTIHRLSAVSELGVLDIKALCKRYRVTPQVLGQGCWAAVLATLSKSLDLVFGVVLSGRDTDESQDLLFPTMNTVPLRVVLHGTATEYLHYVQTTMSSVMEYQQIPLRETQRLARVEGEPLFNTLFLLQNAKARSSDDRQPLVRSVHSLSAVEYPICVEMELTGTSVAWHVACDDEYVSSHDAERILVKLEAALHFFAASYADQVLEFDEQGGSVSVCRLEAVQLINSPLEVKKPAKKSPSQGMTAPFATLGTVIDVLSEISGFSRDAISLDHSIYHLGLDSISAIKASSMLRKRGLVVPVRELLKASSIRQVLALPDVSVHGTTTSPSDIPTDLSLPLDGVGIPSLIDRTCLDSDSVERVLPALPMQVHMLTTWQNTHGLVFFPKFTYKLSGQVSHETVSNAWAAIVDEVPILRTYFVASPSLQSPFVQVVAKAKSLRNRAINPFIAVGEEQWEFVYSATPFALIRVTKQQLGKAELHLHLHHALYDGVSLPVILNRLRDLCGRSSPISVQPDDHNAWCSFVSKHVSSDLRASREQFWTSYLQGAVRTMLLDQPQPAQVQDSRRVFEFRRDVVSNVATLKHTSAAMGFTLQALFFAAYSKVLAKFRRHAQHLDSDNVVFGVYVANRTSHPGLEESPLPTLNIIPLKVDNPASRSIDAIAMDIQKDLLDIGSPENSTAGLWEIHEWTGIRVDTFVNLLSLPKTVDDGQGAVTISEANDSVSRSSGPVDITSYLAGPEMEALSPNRVMDSYVDAIDIEVAVQANALDIGVFCHHHSFTSENAAEMIEDIASTLESL